MRVINVLPDPRHYSYASTGFGGKTLEPGNPSAELPLDKVHHELLWRDVLAGKIQIRLSGEDREFIKQLLAEADRPINVQKPPEKPKPKPKPKKKAKSVSAPKTGVTKSKKPPKAVTTEDLAAGRVSLDQLMRQNTTPKAKTVPGVPVTDDSQRATMQDIQTHMGGRV